MRGRGSGSSGSLCVDMQGVGVGNHLPDGGYRPPDSTMTVTMELPIVDEGPLGGQSQFMCRQEVRSGALIVDYSIEHRWRRGGDDHWHDIYRIDTSHGSLHTHQLGLM